MTKREIILTVFGDAPHVWTAEQLQQLESATGEHVTRAELCAAYTFNASPIYGGTARGVAEILDTLHGLEFSERLQLLTRDVFPAVEFLETARRRVAESCAEAAGDVDGVDGGTMTGGTEA